MTDSERRHYRLLLRKKEAALVATLRRRDGIAIEERLADSMDEVSSSYDRDLAILVLDRDAALLREVRAALAEIEAGTFGVCVVCEEAISPRRLDALPWARLCVVCQDGADRRGRMDTATDDIPLSSAA